MDFITATIESEFGKILPKTAMRICCNYFKNNKRRKITEEWRRTALSNGNIICAIDII